MSSQPSEVRQAYIDALILRNTIAEAIANSQQTAQQQEGFRRWASPKIVINPKTRKPERQYSEKFLAYCADDRFKQWTEGKTPTQISLEKINAATNIIQQESLNRQLLRNDLTLQEARLKDLRLQLPPAEQVMSLEELQLLQAGADAPRYDDTPAASHAAADATEVAALEAAEALMDHNLSS